jgi:hypothetical protein
LPIELLLERGLVEPLQPGAGGQFAWSEEGVIAEHLENAGFVEYEVESVDFPIRYASVDAWWNTSRSMSIRAGRARVDDPAELLAALADAAREWTADDGSVTVPARTWVAAATG